MLNWRGEEREGVQNKDNLNFWIKYIFRYSEGMKDQVNEYSDVLRVVCASNVVIMKRMGPGEQIIRNSYGTGKENKNMERTQLNR